VGFDGVDEGHSAVKKKKKQKQRRIKKKKKRRKWQRKKKKKKKKKRGRGGEQFGDELPKQRVSTPQWIFSPTSRRLATLRLPSGIIREFELLRLS